MSKAKVKITIPRVSQRRLNEQSKQLSELLSWMEDQKPGYSSPKFNVWIEHRNMVRGLLTNVEAMITHSSQKLEDAE